MAVRVFASREMIIEGACGVSVEVALTGVAEDCCDWVGVLLASAFVTIGTGRDRTSEPSRSHALSEREGVPSMAHPLRRMHEPMQRTARVIAVRALALSVMPRKTCILHPLYSDCITVLVDLKFTISFD
jgi:hypothetical protein